MWQAMGEIHAILPDGRVVKNVEVFRYFLSLSMKCSNGPHWNSLETMRPAKINVGS